MDVGKKKSKTPTFSPVAQPAALAAARLSGRPRLPLGALSPSSARIIMSLAELGLGAPGEGRSAQMAIGLSSIAG
jgi:hypothetical protein